jgi:hypothetical protein
MNEWMNEWMNEYLFGAHCILFCLSEVRWGLLGILTHYWAIAVFSRSYPILGICYVVPLHEEPGNFQASFCSQHQLT